MEAKLRGAELFILRPHERIRLSNLLRVAIETLIKGKIEKPILVERNHFVILDGHHRVEVAKLLGVPLRAILVDYDEVELSYWGRLKPSKKEVIEAALKGKLFPPKTTRHKLRPKLTTDSG